MVDNQRTTFDGKFASKRMRCPQGNTVIVSHSYGEPRGQANLFDNVTLEEDLWFRFVKSYEVGGPTLAHPLTLLQHVWRMKIRLDESPGDTGSEPEAKQRRARTLTEFPLLQVEGELKEGERYIENALLDGFGNVTFAAPSHPVDFGGHPQ